LHPPSHPLPTTSLTSHPASFTHAHPVRKPFWGHGGGSFPFNGGSGSGSNGPSNAQGTKTNGVPFDVEEANRTRAIHGAR